jgi:hypothetical protein
MAREWARHVRLLLRRILRKRDLQAEKNLIREAGHKAHAEGIAVPARAPVEDLLSAVAGIPEATLEVEVWVPQELTLGGEPVATDIALAVLVDKLLDKGLFPAGCTLAVGGVLYRYRREQSASRGLDSSV